MTFWKRIAAYCMILGVLVYLTGCTLTSSQATLDRQQQEPWWLVPALADEVYPQEVMKEVYPSGPVHP